MNRCAIARPRIGVARISLAVLTAYPVSACFQIAHAQAVELPPITVSADKPAANAALDPTLPIGKSSVGERLIGLKNPSSSPAQLISNLPGVNSSSDDATGLFNSTVTIRGFVANQIGWSLEGVPLNAAVNYNVFPHQYTDSENIHSITVNQSSADSDAPSPNASGGTIAIRYRKPAEELGLFVQQSFGSDSFRRSFARLDTGRNEQGLAAFGSVSYSSADKFRGSGGARRFHGDLKVDWKLAPAIHIDGLFSYNDQLNYFFKPTTLPQFQSAGRKFDYLQTPSRPTPGPGSQVESSLADYYQLQKNPFTQRIGTIAVTSKLNDRLALRIQPYRFSANGGGGNGFLLNENDSRLGSRGRDLNGDGDTLDRVAVYRITKGPQARNGLISKLTYADAETQVSFGYMTEYAKDYQHRPYISVNADGQPADSLGDTSFIAGSAGNVVEDRNRITRSKFSQPFLTFDTTAFGHGVRLLAGVRSPELQRRGQNLLVAVDSPSLPINTEARYRKLLPNVGVSWDSQSGTLFFNASRTFRAPDNTTLFDQNRDRGLRAETAKVYEGGYRYASEGVALGATAFAVDFTNRQLTALGPDLQTTVVTNVGETKVRGLQVEAEYKSRSGLLVYASATHTKARLSGALPISAFTQLDLTGKNVPATPNWLGSLVGAYKWGRVMATVEGKYVGPQYATLVNDERVGGFAVVDLGLTWSINSRTKLRGTVYNVFDRTYLSSVNFTNNARAISGISGSAPTYSIGAPRTFVLSLSAEL